MPARIMAAKSGSPIKEKNSAMLCASGFCQSFYNYFDVLIHHFNVPAAAAFSGGLIQRHQHGSGFPGDFFCSAALLKSLFNHKPYVFLPARLRQLAKMSRRRRNAGFGFDITGDLETKTLGKIHPASVIGDDGHSLKR